MEEIKRSNYYPLKEDLKNGYLESIKGNRLSTEFEEALKTMIKKMSKKFSWIYNKYEGNIEYPCLDVATEKLLNSWKINILEDKYYLEYSKLCKKTLNESFKRYKYDRRRNEIRNLCGIPHSDPENKERYIRALEEQLWGKR